MTTDYRALARHLRECVGDDEGNWARINIDALLDAAECLERFAALAQPEPVGPSDEALIAAAKAAVDTYPRVSELPYFLDPDATEYEPMLLALRAAAALPLPSPSDHHLSGD